MKDENKKKALARVFGVVNRDGIVSAIPNVPGLKDAITCSGCPVKTKKGIPVGIGEYMTDEQKAEFKSLTRRRIIRRRAK